MVGFAYGELIYHLSSISSFGLAFFFYFMHKGNLDESEIRITFVPVGPLTLTDLTSFVLPSLNSLDKINRILASIGDKQNSSSLVVKRISYASPLEISLGGWVPELINVIREWRKDVAWRNDHERNMARIQEKQAEIELDLKKLELADKKLEYIQQVVAVSFPNSSIEQQWSVARDLLPELDQLDAAKLQIEEKSK